MLVLLTTLWGLVYALGMMIRVPPAALAGRLIVGVLLVFLLLISPWLTGTRSVRVGWAARKL